LTKAVRGRVGRWNMAILSRLMLGVLGLLAVSVMVCGSAAAHATHYSPDGKIKFVYGHLNEPAYTFVKTGLDLSIIDNATGKGISGLDTDARTGGATPKLLVFYRYGAEGGPTKNISGDFRAQHGQVGKYTHPITFTRPGLYSIVITGTINGTTFQDFVIAPAHAIEAEEDIMWPDSVASDAEQVERIETLEARIAELESAPGGNAAGLEFLPLVLAVAFMAVALRRR
jgi:hypothetical protein